MLTNVFYVNATESIKEFLSLEFDDMRGSDVDKLISMFHGLCNWEEEGLKVRPKIILTNNIGAIVRNIGETQKIAFYTDPNTTNFNQRLKALMCFCVKDWTIYVNYSEDKVEYGIVKVLNSIKDRTLYDLLFDNVTRVSLAPKFSCVYINVVSTGLVVLHGLQGNTTSICFNLMNTVQTDWEREIRTFVEDCTSKIRTTKRKLNDIKNLLINIFTRVFNRLHGTLCLVVDKDYKDTKGFLADGTWLPEPIEFGKLFLNSKTFSESKLRSYADILETMLNYDGITVMDNTGRLLAYNVFVETNLSVTKNIVGGARKRAAYTLLNNSSRRIIGVYFQSQEGDAFYKCKKEAKREVALADKEAQKEYKQLEINLQ